MHCDPGNLMSPVYVGSIYKSFLTTVINYVITPHNVKLSLFGGLPASYKPVVLCGCVVQVRLWDGELMPPARCQPYCEASPSHSACLACLRVNDNADHHCRTAHTHHHSAPVQARSVCPWYHVITQDEDRYPADMVEARCSCSGHCIGTEPGTSACEPVYHTVPVLYKSGADARGRCVYVKRKVQLAVACTCTATPNSD